MINYKYTKAKMPNPRTTSKSLSRQNLESFSTFSFTHYSPIPTMSELYTFSFLWFPN